MAGRRAGAPWLPRLYSVNLRAPSCGTGGSAATGSRPRTRQHGTSTSKALSARLTTGHGEGSPCRSAPTGCRPAPSRDPPFQIRAPERPDPVAAPLAGSDVHGGFPLWRARRAVEPQCCGEARRTRFSTGVSGAGPVGNAAASHPKAVRAAGRGGTRRPGAHYPPGMTLPHRQAVERGEAISQQSAGLPGSPPRTGYGRSVSCAMCLGDGFPGRRRRCAASALP